MTASETRLLREEMEKRHTEYEKNIAILSDTISVLKNENTELRLKLLKAEKKLAYYENPNSPPSQGSFPSQRRKKASKRSKPKKGGARKGHTGASHHKKSDRTETHMPKTCKRCGGRKFTVIKKYTKQVTDIDVIPNATTTTHIIHVCRCKRCNVKTEPLVGCIKGTGFGPNVLYVILQFWAKHASLKSILELLRMFNITASKGTIFNALFAIANALKAPAKAYHRRAQESKFAALDETGFVMGSRNGFVWIMIGGKYVFIHAAGSRSRAVFDHICKNQNRPITTDGYKVYENLDLQQRCWAHILRIPENLAWEGETEALLHKKLQHVFHNAKNALPDASLRRDMEAEVCSIADQYTRLGYKFGKTLNNAAPHLFTFVMHPGMEPTNNECERGLRGVVIQRKIRHRIAGEIGMEMFGILMTCLLTWDRQHLDPREQVLKALVAT